MPSWGHRRGFPKTHANSTAEEVRACVSVSPWKQGPFRWAGSVSRPEPPAIVGAKPLAYRDLRTQRITSAVELEVGTDFADDARHHAGGHPLEWDVQEGSYWRGTTWGQHRVDPSGLSLCRCQDQRTAAGWPVAHAGAGNDGSPSRRPPVRSEEDAGTGPEWVERVDWDGGQVPNSGRRDESCAWSRWMIDECICETRDSLRSSVAPISFIVSSS